MSKLRYDAALVDLLVDQLSEGGEPQSPAAAWLNGVGALSDLDAETAASAVEAAARLALVERLAEARDSAADKQVRKAAGAALHRMRAAGKEVPVVRAPTSWALTAEEVELLPPVALVGPPETDGYFPFVMVTWGPEGACVSAGLAGAGQGFRGDEHGHLSRSQARKVVEDVRRDHSLSEVPFHEALHILERAFDLGGGKRPSGWGHLLEHLSEEQLSAARLIDPLRHLPTELDPDCLHAIDPLMEGEHRVVMFLDEDVSHTGASACLEAIHSQVELGPDQKKRRIAGIIDDTANEAMAGVYRESWALALDVVAWLAARRGDDAQRDAARHTALALRADMPGADIPFVREWVDQQLQALTELASQFNLEDLD